jgi:hypothetical protein
MGLNSGTGSGVSPAFLAQLEGLAGRGAASTEQLPPELAALVNAQSLLGYANGGGNNRGGVAGNSIYHHNAPSPADGSHSPHTHPQSISQQPTPTVSEALALLQRAMQRDSASAQHGFGAPDRQP